MSRQSICVVFVCLAIILTNCQSENKKENDDCRKSEHQKYFYSSFANNSTSADYLVFTAIETQTGLKKEICCESNSLYRAFQNEGFSKRKLNDPFKEYNDILKLKPCDHRFEFLNQSSLECIGFYSYNYSSKCADSLAKTIRKGKLDSIFNDTTLIKHRVLSKYFGRIEDYKKEIYLIHYLSLKGIYCGKDDISGSIVIRKIIK